MHKAGILVWLTVFDFIISAIGGYWQLTVTNPVTANTGVTTASTPNPVTFLSWVWSSASFMFSAALLQIPALPLVLSGFFGLLSVLWIIMLILVIRGD